MLNTSISYFLFAYKNTLLRASQHASIVSNVDTITSIILYGLQAIILLVAKNYYLYLVILPISTIINNLLVERKSKEKFPEYYPDGEINDKIKKEIIRKLPGLLASSLCSTSRTSLDSIFIQFAKDCVDDRWYEEALTIYEALWDMDVRAEYEWGEDDWDPDSVDLQTLVDAKIVQTDLKQVELLTLYTIYQTEEPENRAKQIYYQVLLFPNQDFQMEDMFRAGPEKLRDSDRFWKDWISLMEGRPGDVFSNFLKEAIPFSTERLHCRYAAITPKTWFFGNPEQGM